MFHLKSGIHFHEVKLICDCIKNEFNCSCIDIANSLCRLDCSLTNLLPNALTDLGWCLLDDLLVTSLDRAVTLIQVYIVAVTISEYLEFNVARLFYILLNNDMLITKALKCFTLGCV